MVKCASAEMLNSHRSTSTWTVSSILTLPSGPAVPVSKPNENPIPTPTSVTPKARTLTLADPLSRNL